MNKTIKFKTIVQHDSGKKIYNVQVWTRYGKNQYCYCGIGRFCDTLLEVIRYKIEYLSQFKVRYFDKNGIRIKKGDILLQDDGAVTKVEQSKQKTLGVSTNGTGYRIYDLYPLSELVGRHYGKNRYQLTELAITSNKVATRGTVALARH